MEQNHTGLFHEIHVAMVAITVAVAITRRLVKFIFFVLELEPSLSPYALRACVSDFSTLSRLKNAVVLFFDYKTALFTYIV